MTERESMIILHAIKNIATILDGMCKDLNIKIPEDRRKQDKEKKT